MANRKEVNLVVSKLGSDGVSLLLT